MNRPVAVAFLFVFAVNGLRVQPFDAAVAQAASAPADRGVVYTGWGGGCRISKIADVSCTMYQEAKSVAGKRFGLIAYGEDGASRYLSVEVELAMPSEGRSFFITIDGRPVANGVVTCRPDEAFCSATIVVDKRLLARLKAGRTLMIEDRERREVELSFPLDGFAHARAYLL
jgi:invasion protein IalB